MSETPWKNWRLFVYSETMFSGSAFDVDIEPSQVCACSSSL